MATAAPSATAVERSAEDGRRSPIEPAPTVSSAPPSLNLKAANRPQAAGPLREERLLLETASVALMKGDHASALVALRQHAARFPRGALAQEREALLVQALAASGNEEAAQNRAEDFKRNFPGSLQRDSVEKASKAK
jgi:TolA-binding protein